MITKSEKQVMELLWGSSVPLTASEIVKLLPDKGWKSSYIHIIITSLLKKKMIVVIGMKPSTRNYARTFAPAITKEEYLVSELQDKNAFGNDSLPDLLTTYLKITTDEKLLRELYDIIKKRLETLK